jgi:hypothetical protein
MKNLKPVICPRCKEKGYYNNVTQVFHSQINEKVLTPHFELLALNHYCVLDMEMQRSLNE